MPDQDIRRTRVRRPMRGLDKNNIARRVIELHDADDQARSEDKELRIQRYAKFRQWVEGDTSWRWEGSSDVPLPDLTTTCLRMQDTLHNAVMSGRPPVTSRALSKANKEKQRHIDALQDFQFFQEQMGEKVVEELVDAFVNDGVFTAYIPWVNEERSVLHVRTFDGIPPDQDPREYFDQLLKQEYTTGFWGPKDDDGWDWNVFVKEGDAEPIVVKFYTKGTEVEMVSESTAVMFDGPKIIVKEYEEVLTPPRTGNLQIPGPSNPDGAPHVILVDHPTVDEIKRLQRSGFYDAASKEDMDQLEAEHRDETADDDMHRAVDSFQGEDHGIRDERQSPSQKTLTRYVCFDTFDVDGDGLDEDMIWWVLRERKLLLRAKRLTEVYPASPPRRPFAEANFLPVKGRRAGIGLLELGEGLHDVKKKLMDMMIDAGDLATMPFFFYRASSQMKPEVLHVGPGDGVPLPDPKNDINIPKFDNASQSYGLNMFAVMQQMDEKLTVIGDLQLGRIPPGKSSALRTAGTTNALLEQGEARPQRILRRFFMGMVEIWKQMFRLNKAFLGDEKQFRISGHLEPNEDPFVTIRQSDLEGDFDFTFDANVQNSSLNALSATMDEIATFLISDIAIQLGISTPDTIYRIMRDKVKATGQDPDRYTNPPTPNSMTPGIVVQEAIREIIAGNPPQGQPLEPVEEHLQGLMDFAESDDFGRVPPENVEIFFVYIKKVEELLKAQQQQAQAGQSAGGIQDQLGPGGGGVPGPAAGPANLDQPQLSPNELLDESLPGAQGRVQ